MRVTLRDVAVMESTIISLSEGAEGAVYRRERGWKQGEGEREVGGRIGGEDGERETEKH